MSDKNKRSCAARGSGWAVVIAIVFCVAGDLSMAVPPFDDWPDSQVRRDEERERRDEERQRRAQAIADAPMRQVEATRQLCYEIAALRKEVAALRAAVDEMRKQK
jgi:hypothetical protein